MDAASVRHAVTWSTSGVATVMASLGGGFDQAYDINDSGEVVGQSRDSSGASVAALWSGGQVYDLNHLLVGSPSMTLSFAWGNNDLGWIVGQGKAADGLLHGFVLTPVPEPSTWAMMLVGLSGLGFAGLRRTRKLARAVVRKVA